MDGADKSRTLDYSTLIPSSSRPPSPPTSYPSMPIIGALSGVSVEEERRILDDIEHQFHLDDDSALRVRDLLDAVLIEAAA